MPASTYAANAILNHFLRGVAAPVPERVFLSLHTADPGNTGVAEVNVDAWPAYRRQDPAGGLEIGSGFSAAALKGTKSAKQLLWAANDGAAPVTVTHFGIWDAPNGGNLLLYGALAAPKTYQPSDEGVMHAQAFSAAVA